MNGSDVRFGCEPLEKNAMHWWLGMAEVRQVRGGSWCLVGCSISSALSNHPRPLEKLF